MRFWSDEDGMRQYYALREGSVIIGRHPSCHVVIPGRNVSKRHLQCVIENNVCTIRDLGSSNGTQVNGAPVNSCVLKHGDELALGGYRMVFDAEAAAPGAADPYAAQGGFDYEPAGASPTEPVAAADRPPAPAFDGEPDGDQTPADGTFVPQAYAPQTAQPQVVARDGHMYLRDPRSNREVEIVPRGVGGPTNLTGYYADRDAAEKRKNTYLIGAAIGVGLLMIIALAWTSGEPTEKIEKKGPAFSSRKYSELTDEALELMKAGDFGTATKKLVLADKEYAQYRVAGNLIEIARRWEKSGKSLDDFNWLSVDPLLRALRDSRWSSATVQTFAADRIDWIYNIENHRAVATKALKYLADGKPEQALAEFQKLPPNKTVYNEYKHKIAETQAACFELHLGLAQRAFKDQEWDRAITEYQAARPFASELQKEDLARGIKLANKWKDQEKILSSANLRRREDTPGSLKAALRLLDGIDSDGPLARRRDELRGLIEARIKEVELEGVARLARDAYNDGRGAEAIDIITRHRLTALYGLRTKVETLEKLLKQADAAYDDKQYDLAKQLWTQAATEESAPNNRYHKTAVTKLDRLKQSSKDIALDYNRRADIALQKGDGAKARALYLNAMRWDPLATIGREGLRNLDHLALVYYNKARQHRYDGQKKLAIEMFEKTRDYAGEGSKYYQRAGEHIAELKAEMDKGP